MPEKVTPNVCGDNSRRVLQRFLFSRSGTTVVGVANTAHVSVSAGGLSLAVEGPSKAEISCQDNKDGTCTVSYMPTAPGDYNIIVKFDDKHIPGSPFTAKITGTEPRLMFLAP